MTRVILCSPQDCSANPCVAPFDVDGRAHDTANAPIFQNGKPARHSDAADVMGTALCAIPGYLADSQTSKNTVRLLTEGPRPWDWDYDALAVQDASEGHALYLTTTCVLERR